MAKRVKSNHAIFGVVASLVVTSCHLWLQGIVLDVLVQMGIIRSNHFWLDVEHIQEAIQNVLICLEMVVFSVIQQYAYHVFPYSGEAELKLKLNKKNE